jgi:hypothetical protein
MLPVINGVFYIITVNKSLHSVDYWLSRFEILIHKLLLNIEFSFTDNYFNRRYVSVEKSKVFIDVTYDKSHHEECIKSNKLYLVLIQVNEI